MPLQIHERQVLGRVGEGRRVAGGDVEHTFVGGNRALPDFVVGAVADVEKTDVVVLAVEAAERLLVVQRVPVRADAVRIRGAVFQVDAVGAGAVGLVLDVADA